MKQEEGIRNLTETIGEEPELSYIRRIIAEHRWIFAKTYAAFCPHEYTLRKEWGNDEDFRALVNFIWRNGLDARYGKKDQANRYWFDHKGGYYYFIFPGDTDGEGNAADGVILINRAKISDFDFRKDEACGIVRCARHRERSDAGQT